MCDIIGLHYSIILYVSIVPDKKCLFHKIIGSLKPKKNVICYIRNIVVSADI